jgi:hypothetical protein
MLAGDVMIARINVVGFNAQNPGSAIRASIKQKKTLPLDFVIIVSPAAS